MLFLMDTCFCLHFTELYDEKLLDLREILKKFRIAITDEIKREILHFKLDSILDVNSLLIIKVSEEDLSIYNKSNEFLSTMDLADQTLWIVAYKNRVDDYIILSDDYELNTLCVVSNIKAFSLPVFLLLMVREGEISKNLYAKCLRFWQTKKRFSNQKLKIWKKRLQQI